MRLIAAAFVIFSSLTARATPLDAKTRDLVLDKTLAFIDSEYVFPELAKKIVADITQRRQKGAYALTTAEDFAHKLSDDLKAHDRHLGVIFAAHRPLPPDRPPEARMTRADIEDERKMGELVNFGFAKLEILAGNIGYLKLDGFFDALVGGDTAVAAMAFLANTDALIIDLRENHGGDPTMVQLLGGYLFEGEPVHFNDFVMRDPKKTQQYWTMPWVPGKKYYDKPVFVLTSHQTFSCAEEFTYDLQTQKRSTTIGEATGGGAHPVALHRITDRFGVAVPFARALNPVTHTDWETVGVHPDVEIDATHALAKAKVLAVQRIKPRDPRHGEILKRVLKDYEAELAKP